MGKRGERGGKVREEREGKKSWEGKKNGGKKPNENHEMR